MANIQTDGGSNRLKTCRIAAGLSQASLARSSGISIQTIMKYETGAKSLDRARITTLAALARACNCRMSDLLTEDVLVQISGVEF